MRRNLKWYDDRDFYENMTTCSRKMETKLLALKPVIMQQQVVAGRKYKVGAPRSVTACHRASLKNETGCRKNVYTTKTARARRAACSTNLACAPAVTRKSTDSWQPPSRPPASMSSHFPGLPAAAPPVDARASNDRGVRRAIRRGGPVQPPCA